MKTQTETMQRKKMHFMYNSAKKGYYVIFEGQRAERCVYISKDRKYFYKKDGNIYLTDEETVIFEDFINN